MSTNNIMTWVVATLLVGGPAQAEFVTASDGGTAVYGACNGIAIDFDATAAPNAIWSPSLVSGQIYTLNSVAIKNVSGNTGTYYIGIYTGFSGGALSGFKGVSDTAKDFSTSANNWLTFTFSNLNYKVTVDSIVGSGSGLLYFVYQSGTSALTSPNVTLGTDKFGTDTYMTNSLASIIAYGGLVANRSPQYQATMTSTVPTEPPAAPTGLSATSSNAAVILSWMASSGATSYNVKRSVSSGTGYATLTNVTGMTATDAGLVNGTTYYYVVSATNSIGESTNSVEVNGTPLPPPEAPIGVVAIASNTTVTLTWTASTGATSYNVKRSLTSGSGYTTIANVTGPNVADAGLTYGVTYYYVVSALNSYGEGADSSEVNATTDGLPGAVAVTNSTGVSAVVGSNGIYQINFSSPKWIFLGNLAQTLTNNTISTGTDNIGTYSEITFNCTSAVPHAAGIRLYDSSPVVIFSDTALTAGANDLAFPHWLTYPSNLSHISFIDTFSTYSFTKLYEPWAPCDNLLLYFNTNHDAFAISAAANYTISTIRTNSDASISCGINSAISQLPSGFTHRFILTAQNGINQVYSTWGNSLLALAGKTPPANDAAVELAKLGYWTDNGAAYYPYYNGTAPGIANTLLSVKAEFSGKGVPISYMQLDSWWYKKGPNQVWNDPNNGFSLYEPDPYLFTNGLVAFQQQLGLPLITHNRWVYTNSPYLTASNYTASGTNSGSGVIIDPRFWTNIMTYLKNSGGITYEQDWLNYRGMPSMNLTDPPAYLNNMAWAAAANGINLQYCMVRGCDYLQGTLYTNLMTIRTSEDRFDTTRWAEHLYGSRLAQAMGIWPWTDVCMSSETRNILLSTLSAGPVGPGDALGAVNATNLLKCVRPDGVIVKPDVPLVPVDDTYINDALGQGRPFVATTYTDITNSRTLYVFAYAENPANLSASFKPADFGITNNAYVYDYFAATGVVVNAGSTFNFNTTMPNVTNGGSYFITVPIGASGLAFLGDTNKFVTRGKKRISSFSDTGLLRATVAFAAGETNVALTGYAPSSPYALALAGTTNNLTYDPTTHIFSLNVSPDDSGTATVGFSLSPVPSPQIKPIIGNQFQISWPSEAVGYVLEKSTNLIPPVVWSQTWNAVISTNGQNVVIITNSGSTEFYRLRQ
jgi:hypothetical protein